ncbi:MAG: uroporphyrinogen decarboxylase [Chloroflexota bacterium]|nr:MAG: uroporphyrinogen decarboxylase [Chloroflexota bacterium]
MTPDEKFEARFNDWNAAPGMQFATPEGERLYHERVQMIKDVVQVKKPVRVPVCPNIGFYPFAYAGVTAEEAMYDFDKLGSALKKYHADFLPDSLASSPIYGTGKLFEILDYKLYRWPGHGVPAKTPYQCIEAEYMRADEYDQFIADPSNFFLRTYLPRIFGALTPWQMLAPLTDILELPFIGGFMVPVGIPPVQESFQKLIEAGQHAMEWIQTCLAIDGATISTLGIPPLIGGFTKAPFDTLGDTLRGTRAIMLDMFRQPHKLLAALDRLVPLAIDMGVRSTTGNHNPIAFIPLHKGADGFMSNKDFKNFYWPTLKAVILGLIEQGVVPYMFVEGGYNQRLDIIADPDIPKGKTIWIFDQTDMKEVKKRFTGWACFGGNVPVSLLKAATVEQVQNHVRCLLDDVAYDGGYILSTGAVLDDARPENLHAMIDTGKQFGKY